DDPHGRDQRGFRADGALRRPLPLRHRHVLAAWEGGLAEEARRTGAPHAPIARVAPAAADEPRAQEHRRAGTRLIAVTHPALLLAAPAEAQPQEKTTMDIQRTGYPLHSSERDGRCHFAT